MNGRCSSCLYNNAGVLQGAVLSPFLLSVQTDSLTSCHSTLLTKKGLDDHLSRLATWSADHGLIITRTKCVECFFYSKNTSSQLPFSFPDGESLPREQTVNYLGAHSTSNMTWSTHIDIGFTKCLKLSFFIRRLRRMNVHKSLLQRIVSVGAIPLILHCSPIIFPGLFNKNFVSIKKCIRLLSPSSGVAYTHICKVLTSPHFNSCKRLSTSIITDPLHPLHSYLANALSTSNTRSSFKLLRCRTSFLQKLPHPQPGPSSCKPTARSRSPIFQSFLRSTPFILSFVENL